MSCEYLPCSAAITNYLERVIGDAVFLYRGTEVPNSLVPRWGVGTRLKTICHKLGRSNSTWYRRFGIAIYSRFFSRLTLKELAPVLQQWGGYLNKQNRAMDVPAIAKVSCLVVSKEVMPHAYSARVARLHAVHACIKYTCCRHCIWTCMKHRAWSSFGAIMLLVCYHVLNYWYEISKM